MFGTCVLSGYAPASLMLEISIKPPEAPDAVGAPPHRIVLLRLHSPQ